MDPRTETRDVATAANTAASPIQEAPTPPVDVPEEEPATFDREYVAKLRSEAAQRRREAKEAGARLTAMEVELVALRESAFKRALVDVNVGQRRRLVDTEDLLTFGDRSELIDDDGRPDPAKITAAIEGLIATKPHLAMPTGTVTRGVQGGSFVQPAPSLGQLLGHAARGEPIDRR